MCVWGGGVQESDIPPCKFYTSLSVCHSPKPPPSHPKGRVRDVKEGEPEKVRARGGDSMCTT